MAYSAKRTEADIKPQAEINHEADGKVWEAKRQDMLRDMKRG